MDDPFEPAPKNIRCPNSLLLLDRIKSFFVNLRSDLTLFFSQSRFAKSDVTNSICVETKDIVVVGGRHGLLVNALAWRAGGPQF